MKLDLTICEKCLENSLINANGKFSFKGYSMYFDRKKSHFFVIFIADILNYGKKVECEIEVFDGEKLARKIFSKEDFRHSFKDIVPIQYHEEILRNGTMSKECRMYDAYLLNEINENGQD